MTDRAVPFRRGSQIRYCGRHFAVEGWDCRWVTLVADGYRQRVGFVDLLSSPHFSPVEVDDGDVRRLVVPLDAVPKQVLERAYTYRAVLLEMRTGYQSGDPDDPLPHEPRSQFDPDTTTIAQRVAAAHRETKIGQSTLRGAWKAYRDGGIMALVDKRYLRVPRNPADGLDVRLVDEIKRHAHAQVSESTLTRKRFTHEVLRNCEREHGVGQVAIPGKARLAAAIDELTRGMGLFGTSKRRREHDAKPDTPYRYRPAVQPGESVIIDSTRLDVMVIDPVTLEAFPVDLVAAIDRATRRCVGKLLTPVGSNRVEAALLLLDILTPLRSRPEWGDVSDDRYCGVPRELIIRVLGDTFAAGEFADGVLITPQSVTVDNAWIYKSQVFLEACRRLGISVIRARKLNATDKAIMERFFGTLSADLLPGLPGFKASSVENRGSDVEGSAWLFAPELEALIDAYLVRAYHPRPHDGLRLPHIPHRELSPNEMYDELIRIGGCIYMPPSRDIYFDLLPVAWRTIQPYGVEILGLIYDDLPDAEERVLEPLRYARSPYGGRRPGQWPIRYDPRDLSRVFVQDPSTGNWGELPWRHAVGAERPFTDSLLTSARRIASKEMAGARPPKELFAKIVNELIDEAQERAATGRDTRRARCDRLRTSQAGQDRPALTLATPPPPVDPAPELTDHSNGVGPTPLVIEPLPSALEDTDD